MCRVRDRDLRLPEAPSWSPSGYSVCAGLSVGPALASALPQERRPAMQVVHEDLRRSPPAQGPGQCAVDGEAAGQSNRTVHMNGAGVFRTG